MSKAELEVAIQARLLEYRKVGSKQSSFLIKQGE
jgi:hypothetical protein